MVVWFLGVLAVSSHTYLTVVALLLTYYRKGLIPDLITACLKVLLRILNEHSASCNMSACDCRVAVGQ